jgi:hypothetical protein
MASLPPPAPPIEPALFSLAARLEAPASVARFTRGSRPLLERSPATQASLISELADVIAANQTARAAHLIPARDGAVCPLPSLLPIDSPHRDTPPPLGSSTQGCEKSFPDSRGSADRWLLRVAEADGFLPKDFAYVRVDGVSSIRLLTRILFCVSGLLQFAGRLGLL